MAESGRKILYRETVGPEPLSPDEVASEYGLPVEAVWEAIDYCGNSENQRLLDEERARETARIKAAGRDSGPTLPVTPGRSHEPLSGR